MDSTAAAICLISGNHLCHNPRVLKEADALHAAGYQILVLGAWMDAELAARDRELMSSRQWRFTPVIDITRNGRRTRCLKTLLRARAKLGRIIGQKFGLQNAWQLGYCAPELLRAARQSGATLFIAHSEQALWAAEKLRTMGFRVGVDMEDWFSEDLLPDARQQRPLRLIRRLEQSLLREAQHTSCPSEAMSQALAQEYGCRAPTPIYNTFAWAERSSLDNELKDRRDRRVPSLHWYSQTLGPGRGLEDLFLALGSVRMGMEVHLRGQLAQGAEKWLAALIPTNWKERVFLHPLVSNAELLSRIAEHDIGFAGEMKYCRSRDLTVTNKIFQYLLAGLAVVASDTAGQMEIAKRATDAVLTYPAGDDLALAELIITLLNSKTRLSAAKEAALKAAENALCWECTSSYLVDYVDSAVKVKVHVESL